MALVLPLFSGHQAAAAGYVYRYKQAPLTNGTDPATDPSTRGTGGTGGTGPTTPPPSVIDIGCGDPDPNQQANCVSPSVSPSPTGAAPLTVRFSMPLLTGTGFIYQCFKLDGGYGNYTISAYAANGGWWVYTTDVLPKSEVLSAPPGGQSWGNGYPSFEFGEMHPVTGKGEYCGRLTNDQSRMGIAPFPVASCSSFKTVDQLDRLELVCAPPPSFAQTPN